MSLSIRPRKSSAVRVGRITRGEDDRTGLCRFALMSAHSIYGTRQSELGCAQTFDEVSTPTLSGILERAECPIGGAEPTLGVLGEDAATSHNPVAVQQGEDVRSQPSGRC
jgi:hypothetical protein